MSRLGVIFAAWQSVDLLPASLTPWITAKHTRLGGHDFTIVAVSVPFEGFPQEETRDRTVPQLRAHELVGNVDHVIESEVPLKETEARGRALKWLVAQGVDLLVQWDSDEMATLDDITRILTFVEANPFVAWFRLCLRNAVFNDRTFLVEPFTPPRIHRVQVGGASFSSARADGFWDDNNVLYNRGMLRDFVRDTDLSSMTIPAAVAAIRHLSWLSTPRSKAKIAYQVARWPECSFRWDEATDRLCFNEAYYAKRGLPLPEVVHDA